MGKLMALRVKNARPGRHADGEGLYLLVKPTGARTWVLRIVLHGRRRDFGLGSVSFDPPTAEAERIPLGRRRVLSLQEAREKATEGRRFAKAGLDPSIEWKKAAAIIPTFSAAAREHHENQLPGWKNGKHRDQWINTLQTYAFPSLGKVPVNQIDHNALWGMLGPVWQEKPETARRVKQRALAVLDYAKARGWRETDAPARALAKLTSRQRKKKGHFAAIPYKELPAVMAALRDAPPTIGRYAVMFNLLTWARPGNVRHAKWTEIDWDAAEWAIPGENMKLERTHIVPLTPAAMDILDAMKAISGGGDLIFPGTKKDKDKKDKPLSDATLSKAFRLAGGKAYTLHGTARSSSRDWAAERGFNNDWCEAQLAHKVKDQTEAAYRRTTFLDQRREKLMPAWAAFLAGKSNVVHLAAAQ